MDRRAWPSFAQHEGDASDVEAALGTSHCLTGTALRDPATLNGRRRGTEDFLGRVAHTTQSAGPRSKAQPIDPVDVFGAASAAAVKQISLRRGSSRLACAAFRDTAKLKEPIPQEFRGARS